MVAWLREFCHTMEIITHTLGEVVNRVRLCCHHTCRSSRGEVHVYGAVMRRWGEGGDRCCIYRTVTLETRMALELDCASTTCLYACMLEFRRTLEIITRTLREVVNRVRLVAWLLGCLVAGILSHSGDHHAHSMRSGKQSEIVRSSHP